MRDVDVLRQHIGTAYRRKDENGMAMGCLAPIYLLYPETTHYRWPRGQKAFDFLLIKLREHFKAVTRNDLQPGDILVFSAQGRRHIGVYLGNGEAIHCDIKTGTETIKLYLLELPVEEVFRWDSSHGRQA